MADTPPAPPVGLTTSDLIRLFAAVGTWLAVVVALFRESIIRWWRRPVLKMDISNEAPRCVMSLVLSPQGPRGKIYYLRVYVENTGKGHAEQVEVVATRLWVRLADGKFQPVSTFHPLNLLWAYFATVYAPRISPRIGRHCDLGRIADPAIRGQLGPNTNLSDVPATAPILDLAVEAKPNSLPHLLRPGVYRLEVKIAADNAKPVTQVVEIALSDRWYADEEQMRSHGVRISAAKPPTGV